MTEAGVYLGRFSDETNTIHDGTVVLPDQRVIKLCGTKYVKGQGPVLLDNWTKGFLIWKRIHTQDYVLYEVTEDNAIVKLIKICNVIESGSINN